MTTGCKCYKNEVGDDYEMQVLQKRSGGGLHLEVELFEHLQRHYSHADAAEIELKQALH